MKRGNDTSQLRPEEVEALNDVEGEEAVSNSTAINFKIKIVTSTIPFFAILSSRDPLSERTKKFYRDERFIKSTKQTLRARIHHYQSRYRQSVFLRLN